MWYVHSVTALTLVSPVYAVIEFFVRRWNVQSIVQTAALPRTIQSMVFPATGAWFLRPANAGYYLRNDIPGNGMGSEQFSKYYCHSGDLTSVL
jgi:hypothetical protein